MSQPLPASSYPITFGRYAWHRIGPNHMHELIFRAEGAECLLYVEPYKATVVLRTDRGYYGERPTLEWGEDQTKRSQFSERFGDDVSREVADLIGRLRHAHDREGVIAVFSRP